jgi:hypothetical protein
MPYPGVPKELTPKMDRCVKKVMKDGKSKSSAIAICKTSIMSQTKPKEKEKPWKTVSDKEPKYVFFSNSAVEKEKTLNAGKEGQVLKNIEIFKSGTYRGIEYKNSALDKMVANFYFLKSHGIFPNVPVRADHPGFSFFGSSGDIIDKVGGYVAELKRVGKKLVADVRITNSNMWEKIQEGTYVSRSAEIGTYDDNEGTIYTPVLFGFAWVDIPAVEGLSPTFNYSRDNKKIEIISLNDANNMNPEENKDTFPPEETPAEVPTETPEVTPAEVPVETPEETPVEAPVETPVEAETEVPVETPAETPVETPVETPTEPMRKESFDKMFPEQAAELKKLKEEAFKEVFNKLVAEGRIAPAMKDKEVEFARTLSEKQFALYEKIKQSSPKIVELDKEQIEGEEPVAPEVGEVAETQKEAEERADKFIEETN